MSVIKDERRNKSQGYILQDERKPPPNPYLASPPSNQYGENSYPTYQQSVMTAPPMNDQQLYSTNQGHPMDQSQDPASFGFQHQNTSNLSYPSTSSNNNGMSVWDHSGMMMPQHTLSNNNNEDNGYIQQEPYHWQATSSYQQDPWSSSPFSPHQQPYENYYGGYNNNNPYEYGDYTDRIYGGNRLEPWGMMMMMPPPFYPNSPMAYNHSSSSWDGASRQQQQDEWHDPPSAMPHNGRQPAFHVVKGPKRTKSVSFAPLSDQVTFS